MYSYLLYIYTHSFVSTAKKLDSAESSGAVHWDAAPAMTGIGLLSVAACFQTSRSRIFSTCSRFVSLLLAPKMCCIGTDIDPCGREALATLMASTAARVASRRLANTNHVGRGLPNHTH